MLAPCICTRYSVRLSGRTKSFQLAYLLVCQIGEKERRREEGGGGGGCGVGVGEREAVRAL